MPRPRVFKSSEILLGEKKEISLADLHDIIQMKQEEFEKVEEATEEVDMEELTMGIEAMINEAEERSGQIISDAEKEAQMIIQEAYNDSKSIFQKAKEDGFQEGLIAGKEAGYLEMEDIIQEAAEIKHQTFLDKKKMAGELEKDIIQLVISSVKKVIDHEIKEDNQLLLNLIREGLKKSTFTESLIIRVSKEDYDVVNASKNKVYMMTDGIESLEVKCEPSLPAGSILIDTLSGTIDSSIETQIRTVEKLFSELLEASVDNG